MALDAHVHALLNGEAEIGTGVKIFDAVGWLLGENFVLDECKSDRAKIFAGTNSPRTQNQIGEQTKTLDREIQCTLDKLLRSEMPIGSGSRVLVKELGGVTKALADEGVSFDVEATVAAGKVVQVDLAHGANLGPAAVPAIPSSAAATTPRHNPGARGLGFSGQIST